jgi:hypothetical protein
MVNSTQTSVDIKAQSIPEKVMVNQYRLYMRSGAGCCLILIVGCALFSGGCSKHEPASQPGDTNQDQSAGAPPPVYTPPAGTPAPVVAASPDGGADLRELNHIYIGWVLQNRRRAKSFDDFVSSSGTQVPPAPAGKKYMIDHNGFIALANQ